MVSEMRSKRIAERIFEELSTLLIMEVADPRLNNVSITHVSVDRELAYAKIYVSSFEGRAAETEIMKGLDHAKGFLRRELANLIPLRSFPQLRFYWDPIPERADHLDKLLDSLNEDKKSSSSDEEATRLDG
jgi:ribosome-binding factor A